MTFLESSGPELSHGGTPDLGTNTKKSSKLPECKKKHFLAIFGVTLQKNFKWLPILDNFDPRRSPYGSSESLCPVFFKTPVKKVMIFKIVGALSKVR